MINDLEEKITIILSIVGTILMLWFLFAFVPKKWHEHCVRSDKWHYIENQCVIDINYRKDCKAIIYRDMQRHHSNSDNWSSTTIMPVYMN